MRGKSLLSLWKDKECLSNVNYLINLSCLRTFEYRIPLGTSLLLNNIIYGIYVLSFQNEYIDSEWSVTLISHLVRGIVLKDFSLSKYGLG